MRRHPRNPLRPAIALAAVAAAMLTMAFAVVMPATSHAPGDGPTLTAPKSA